MKILKNSFIKSILISLLIFFITFVSVYHSSCQLTSEGIIFVSQEEESPKIIDFKFDNQNIIIDFSKKVKVIESFVVESSDEKSIESFLNNGEKIQVKSEESLENNSVNLLICSKTEIGKKYELYCQAIDLFGNSMSFTIPFYGYNNNFPTIVISEVSDYYSGKDSSVEYIELYAMTSGNLFGLELITANNQQVYSLPCANVNAGEYIVVHLRTIDKNLSISELGMDLSLSKAIDSVDGKRDIWIESSESALSPSADIVILNNYQKSKFIDCIIYSKQEYALENDTWKNEKLSEFANKCVEQKVWNSGVSPKDSVYSMDRKTINYISRKNIEHMDKDNMPENNSSVWIGTTKKNRTPGYKNKW